MSSIAAFAGYYAKGESAAQISCLPYDVLSEAEARDIARENPDSFVRVIRSEVDFPESADPYSEPVYERAAENLKSVINRGLLALTEREAFFIYQLRREGHVQTGLVAAASLDEYLAGRIRKHESTRPEKETDRARHIAATSANTGQVYLIFRAAARIDDLFQKLARDAPVADFTAADGVGHTLWLVDRPKDVAAVEEAFREIPALYIADGHHRIAASARLMEEKRAQGLLPPGSPYERVMATIFPHNEVTILPYNRLVNNLGGRIQGDILSQIGQAFYVSPTFERLPDRRGTFGMYIGGKWYRIEPKSPPCHVPPERRIDTAVLQDQLLRPILGIEDPRTDPRLEFIGGIHGVQVLERRCGEVGCVAAFTCYPTSVEELLFISDSGGLMPPKSTWFEPKLRSGLVVRML